MSDNTTTTETAAAFVPGYDLSDVRVYRARLYPDAGGVATVTFLGQVTDATTAFVQEGRSGRPSLFVEVAADETSATEVRVAVVPTGKRVPVLPDGSPSVRLGSVGGQHVYLLSVDGTADRDAYLAEREARREARRAAREAQAALLAAMPANSGGCGDANCPIC